VASLGWRLGCEICGGSHVDVVRPARDVACDLAAAWRGLDSVMFDQPVDIERCRDCGCLFRDRREVPENLDELYRHARYSEPAAARLRDKALADLDAESGRLARLGCRPGARLLEIGSYVGAFLDFARTAGCDIVGVDPNEALAEWCRGRGHEVRTAPFIAELFPGEQFDGVWILNCFEQLSNLDEVLHGAHRLLRPGAPVVIRTPNAPFVEVAHRSSLGFVRQLADANALLGVPYRRCLTSTAIRLLLTRHRFRTPRVRGREFSSSAPDGWPSSWAAWRRSRLAAFTAASIISGRTLHPWLEVVAVA